MNEDRKDSPTAFNGETKSCGCPAEAECDHMISNFQRYCKHNPDAPECRVFDI